MSAISTQWNALPRAAKWLAGLVVFVAAYFLVFTPLMNIRDRLDARGTTLSSAITREADFASPDSNDGGYINTTLSVFGRPKTPGDLKPEQFTRVVNGILEFHGVTDHNVTERRVPLSGETATALGLGKIDRLILEISFEADPATVVDILKELESAPGVAAVGRIRIDKSNIRGEDNQVVRATLSPEAWILTSGSSAPTSSEVIP